MFNSQRRMSDHHEIDTTEVIILCLVLGFSTGFGTIINIVIISAIIGSKKLFRPADRLIIADIVNELILPYPYVRAVVWTT